MLCNKALRSAQWPPSQGAALRCLQECMGKVEPHGHKDLHHQTAAPVPRVRDKGLGTFPIIQSNMERKMVFVLLLRRLKFFHLATSLCFIIEHFSYCNAWARHRSNTYVHAQQYNFHPCCVTLKVFCIRKSATNHVFIKYTLKPDCTKSLEVVNEAHHPPAQDTRSSCNVCPLQKTTSTGPAQHCIDPWQHSAQPTPAPARVPPARQQSNPCHFSHCAHEVLTTPRTDTGLQQTATVGTIHCTERQNSRWLKGEED